MDRPALSTGAWKALLSIAALFFFGLFATELWYAPRTLAPGAAGTLGIKYHELAAWGRARYLIDEVSPDSPLIAYGAQPGDVWMPDRPYDAVRRLESHEQIGLTLFQDGSERHLIVATAPTGVPTDVTFYVTAWLYSAIALTVGLLIGFRQPDSVALRGLSLGLVVLTAFKLIPTYTILPAGPAFAVRHFLWGPIMVCVFACCTVFFLNFPDDQPRNSATKRWVLRYAVPVLAAGFLAVPAGTIARAAGYHVPALQGLLLVNAIGFCLMAMAIMWSNWKHSDGHLRERHFWVIVAFGLLSFTPILAFGTQLSALGATHERVLLWVTRGLSFLGLATFAYATLRNRVVNIGFAVNRVMVYSAASIGMLVSFGLLEWAAHHLIAVLGHETNVLLDGAIALGVFLAFHRMRHAGEGLIEKLFFHAWRAKEEDLRKFVKEAPYFTRSETLLRSFSAALERFTDGAPLAIYRRISDREFGIVAATLTGAPDRVDVDDPLTVSLRAASTVQNCVDCRTSLPGELALPSVHHGELDGFVLLGPKPNGSTYRPDEKDLLGYVAHQVGLDFRALRMERLERDVETLERDRAELRARNDDLREQNELLKGAVRYGATSAPVQ